MSSSQPDRQHLARARRLLARVVEVRRDNPAPVRSRVDAPPAESEDVRDLRARLAHVETELRALQDQVYREAQRHDREVAELRNELQPANIARSLSADARRRGL